MCRAIDVRKGGGTGRALTFTGTQAYQVLKQATDAFLMQECGILLPGDLSRACRLLRSGARRGRAGRRLPGRRGASSRRSRAGTAGTGGVGRPTCGPLRELYYEQIEQDGTCRVAVPADHPRAAGRPPPEGAAATADNCYGILRARVTGPLAIELIWSYWHEEGMLVQALHAILARFQNRRLPSGKDPLSRFDLDPLRPLANLLWGFAEDEMHRLTVRRRAFEYDHEYGLTLLGRAVPDMHTVDRRSRFVESFHALLHRCAAFFKQDDDTTVIADAFPLLNALRETHLILSEGAHNQFGDLPSAARAEMLIMQWLLARPEMRDFLGGRTMVPYEEAWMDRVDAMKPDPGLVADQRHPPPRPRCVRRAAAAGDQVRQLERGQRPAAGGQLGALLAARDPALHPRLPGGHGRRPGRPDQKVDTTVPARLLQARLNGSKQPVYR